MSDPGDIRPKNAQHAQRRPLNDNPWRWPVVALIVLGVLVVAGTVLAVGF